MDQAYCDLCGFPKDSRKSGGGVSGHTVFHQKKSVKIYPFSQVSAPGSITASSSTRTGSVLPLSFLLLHFLPLAAISLDMKLESHLHTTEGRILAWELSLHTMEFLHNVLHTTPPIYSCLILTIIP